LNKNTIPYDVIIIGGGPAGLFTAINIHRNKKCLLLEKNETTGRKLLMSGSGRCNLTHAGDIEAFLAHYGDHFRFLRTAFKHFSNEDLIQFFKERGLYITVDKNGKVFPATDNAVSVLDVLTHECKKKQVTIHCRETVLKIEHRDGKFWLETKGNEYTCLTLVFATGGKSYPSSGSTGDGYGFAQSLGHTIVPPKPALTPIYIHHYPFADISGVSLPMRAMSLFRANKKIKEHAGDIGFTHKGLSGPGILDFSRFMERNDRLEINLIDVNMADFTTTFLAACDTEGKTAIKTFLKRFDLPESLLKLILKELNLDFNEKLAHINKKTRTAIIDSLCRYPFVIESLGGFNMAMVTRGGIPLTEVSAKTMESKIIKHLFFAGEILDIDGDTGGYNIQAAFSTAYLAANAIQ